jgi:GT2 family glycosyltransferase
MRSANVSDIMQQALELQRQGALEEAAALYREALNAQPDNPDCLHMLGVVNLRRSDYLQGIDLIERACVASGWRSRNAFANLIRGLRELVATLSESGDPAAAMRQVQEVRAAKAATRAEDPEPLVSVLVPSYNHTRFVRQALRSVLDQSYRRLELIVIDDGSTDDTPRLVRETLQSSGLTHRFVVREQRGAPATINECIGYASGRYLNVLNSDDLFAPGRIEALVEAVHRGGADWGFSGCALIDAEGRPAGDADRRTAMIREHFEGIEDAGHTSHAFLLGNPAVSTGNIFVTCELAQAIGGFSSHRYMHDWAFCLEAAWRSEPVRVDGDLYRYRLHAGNTISERGNAPAQEADEVVAEYCRRAETQVPPNPLALHGAAQPAKLALVQLMHMRGEPKSPDKIRGLIQRIRDQYRIQTARAVGTASETT